MEFICRNWCIWREKEVCIAHLVIIYSYICVCVYVCVCLCVCVCVYIYIYTYRFIQCAPHILGQILYIQIVLEMYVHGERKRHISRCAPSEELWYILIQKCIMYVYMYMYMYMYICIVHLVKKGENWYVIWYMKFSIVSSAW